MILNVENLSYRYRGGSRPVFHDVSFSLDKGEALTILGANGAGKSTLLNCIANLFRPSSGSICLDGKPMEKMSMREVARIVGYVPQVHNPAYAYTVREFVVMGRTPYIGSFSSPSAGDYRIADESLERMGISHLRDKAYTEISGGERQQVTIARVLTQQPQIILLDEPTAHLDYGNQHRTVLMVKALAENGFTILMTTHNPEHAIILNGKVAILNREGVLGFGLTGDTLNEANLSRLYGLHVKTAYNEEAGRNICFVC